MLPDNIAILSEAAPLLKKHLASHSYTKIAVLADEHTLQHCYPRIKDVLPAHEVIIVPAGEDHKTLDTCTIIWQKLTDFSFDRHSCLIGIGGGVIGDMGGFCAATFKRGINFVLMPTTLLAQADASVGGKTGIDFQHFKNHIGVFQEPAATLIAIDFLSTLPLRELRSGFAEVIKHCIISDKSEWEKISALSLEEQNWDTLIQHSVEFKSSVAAADPREKGLRKILNFGHSIGHAVESCLLADGNRIFHGEAIAIGMIAEAFIASSKKMITAEALVDVSDYLIRIFGKIGIPERHRLMPYVVQDKKNKGGQILMALPERIGKAVWDIPVSEAEISDALIYYTKL